MGTGVSFVCDVTFLVPHVMFGFQFDSKYTLEDDLACGFSFITNVLPPRNGIFDPHCPDHFDNYGCLNPDGKG